MSVVNRSFFYGMIEGKFFSIRTIEREAKVDALTESIAKLVDVSYHGYIRNYAFALIYTNSLEFNWTPDTPEQYRQFETWWDMVVSHQPPEECFLFYAKNVPSPINNGWIKTSDSSLEIWKPNREKPISMKQEAETDPN